MNENTDSGWRCNIYCEVFAAWKDKEEKDIKVGGSKIEMPVFLAPNTMQSYSGLLGLVYWFKART